MGVNSIVLSTWDLEYALQLQNTKRDMYPLFGTSQKFNNAFVFHEIVGLNLIKTMFKSVRAFCKVYLKYGISNQMLASNNRV